MQNKSLLLLFYERQKNIYMKKFNITFYQFSRQVGTLFVVDAVLCLSYNIYFVQFVETFFLNSYTTHNTHTHRDRKLETIPINITTHHQIAQK